MKKAGYRKVTLMKRASADHLNLSPSGLVGALSQRACFLGSLFPVFRTSWGGIEAETRREASAGTLLVSYLLLALLIDVLSNAGSWL